MADVKTKPNDASVEAFISSVEDETKREDCRVICDLMTRITGEQPKMWGPSIVGFGTYHYKYASGREGDWMKIGFSPRKQSLTLYIMDGFDKYDELMASLGKFKTGKSCLYVKKLEDIDLKVLRKLVKASVAHFDKKYGK